MIPARADCLFSKPEHRSTGDPYNLSAALTYQFPAAGKSQSSDQVVFPNTNKSSDMASSRSHMLETLGFLHLSPASLMPQIAGTFFGRKGSNENSAMVNSQDCGTLSEPKSPSFANEPTAHHTPDRILGKQLAECSNDDFRGGRTEALADSRSKFSALNDVSLCSWVDIVPTWEHDTRGGQWAPDDGVSGKLKSQPQNEFCKYNV